MFGGQSKHRINIADVQQSPVYLFLLCASRGMVRRTIAWLYVYLYIYRTTRAGEREKIDPVLYHQKERDQRVVFLVRASNLYFLFELFIYLFFLFYARVISLTISNVFAQHMQVAALVTRLVCIIF